MPDISKNLTVWSTFAAIFKFSGFYFIYSWAAEVGGTLKKPKLNKVKSDV